LDSNYLNLFIEGKELLPEVRRSAFEKSRKKSLITPLLVDLMYYDQTIQIPEISIRDDKLKEVLLRRALSSSKEIVINTILRLITKKDIIVYDTKSFYEFIADVLVDNKYWRHKIALLVLKGVVSHGSKK